MKLVLYSGSLLLMLLLASGCDSSSNEKDEFSNIGKADSSGKISAATSELASQVIKSIPPPVELSAIIKNSGAEYFSDMLNETGNLDKYNTNYLKAANLGVYGADLGYINIYNHKEDALSFLNIVIKLSEQLKVGQFFEFETIKRIADNSNNLDSMLNITQSNFEKMNNYLQEQNRSNISTYMLTGGWIEAMYLTTYVAIEKNDEALYEKIGEQKIVLDQIIILLDFYKNDQNAMALAKDLEELKAVFKEVKIQTVYGEPTMVEENGMLVVKDNSKTTISITKENVLKIRETISKIRKKITD